ncbi:ATP-binding protein [Streptomyces sp. NPDC050400]|uniref:ATP-binding protein n=1 Tax=Streptomyces sp. NPDC050400 TaxID=3365610 RepID=UPI00378BF7D5
MTFGIVRRRPGELPRELTGFIGRDIELTHLTRALGSQRCVTVLGPGGVGKTRLALRAVATRTDAPTPPACLVELSALRDPDLLPHTLAACLGLPEQDTRSQLDVILNHLRDQPALIILDTCEHLVDACAELVDILLRETDGVRVLATSRQPLDVPGEHTFPVSPLAVDDEGGDAVTLFEQRAAAVVPGFEVTDANRDDVVRLCRRLDGIPLAIELATVRLRAVPLRQLIDRLEDRFRLLTGGRRTTLPRHQTLRTAIDWSHELCDERERTLWARLSVFGDVFDLAAAEEVCGFGELTPADVMEVLIDLVDKSVVQRVDEAGAGPAPGDGDFATRYRMLDTIREYGAERLAESGEETAARDRHLDRYVTAADTFDRHFIGDDQMPRCRALRREHPDIRLALEYALGSGERVQKGAGLAGALWGYWQISGLLTEGRYWQQKVAEAFPGSTPERAWALIVGGFITVFQGDPAAAVPAIREGIDIADRLGESLVRARGWLYLQCAYTFLCDFDRAELARAQAQERLAAIGDLTGLVSLDVQAGYQYHLSGDADLALERTVQGLARLGAGSKECWLRGFLYTVAGLAHYAKGDPEASEVALKRALPLKADLGDAIGCGYAVEVLAWVASGNHRHERAAWLFGGSDALWQSTGGELLSGAPVSVENHRAGAEATRAALGADAYERLWQQGATAPAETLFEAALAGTDELAAPEPDVPGQRRANGEALTKREHEVARLAADGLSNREIAERLFISRRTVDAHMERVLAKLGIGSRSRIGVKLAGEGL